MLTVPGGVQHMGFARWMALLGASCAVICACAGVQCVVGVFPNAGIFGLTALWQHSKHFSCRSGAGRGCYTSTQSTD
jgi:hypothetical protein